MVLSESFFSKEWPKKELDALTAREAEQRYKLVLPVWHEVSRKQVLSFSPLLADKIGVNTNEGIPVVAEKIKIAISQTIQKMHRVGSKKNGSAVPILHYYTIFDAEKYGCPKCGGKVVITTMKTEFEKFPIGTCQKCSWEDYG